MVSSPIRWSWFSIQASLGLGLVQKIGKVTQGNVPFTLWGGFLMSGVWPSLVLHRVSKVPKLPQGANEKTIQPVSIWGCFPLRVPFFGSQGKLKRKTVAHLFLAGIQPSRIHTHIYVYISQNIRTSLRGRASK